MLGAMWGVSPEETKLTFACDDFVRAPALTAWRGVSVDAPGAEVWTWVTQVRVAPYSYDWIDNGRRLSPREVLGLPEPVVGESFTASAGRKLGRIVHVEQGRSLTGHILGAYMTYLLAPQADSRTRLLLKVVMETNPVVAQALCVGDLVMARRQLLTIKRLAELRHIST
ncbi:hypothetical protein ACWEOW_14595 [Monashia sp. NPDC004114]